MLTGLTNDISHSKLTEFFMNLGSRLEAGVPEEIQVIGSANIAYVTLPTVLSAQKFFEVFQTSKDGSNL